MKSFRLILATLVFFIGAFALSAQVRVDGIVVKAEDACGLDKVYDFDVPHLTKAPKGYKPVFVEHYGRHGSRYAYSMSFYSMPMQAMQNAVAKGILTSFGKELHERFSAKYKSYTLRMGDLTGIGITQQKRIASTMYDAFPQAFGKGATVYASASNSPRSMMSMAAFCLGLQARAPYLDIVARTGYEFLPGTNPRDRHNPLACAYTPRKLPFNESLDNFQDRKIDSDAILSKLFTDVSIACEGMDRRDLVRRLYVLVAGMNSIPEGERTDFSGLFTEEEFARMWLVDNYQRFLEYFNYYEPCGAVVLDMIRDAERRIACGEHGVTLRFGHDHVMMPVFEIMGIDGAGKVPQTSDEVAGHFRTWNSPMGTNVQMVFYMKKGSDRILFKVLRNGVEAHLAIPAESYPYYSWDEFKKWISENNQ